MADEGTEPICSSSVVRKLVKASFRSSMSETTMVLELHSDIMGPMRTLTRRGAYYVITIVDDFNRYC